MSEDKPTEEISSGAAIAPAPTPEQVVEKAKEETPMPEEEAPVEEPELEPTPEPEPEPEKPKEEKPKAKPKAEAKPKEEKKEKAPEPPRNTEVKKSKAPEFTVADAKDFKDSISAISDLVSEASFKFNQDGVLLRAMDPANVAMVNFVMTKDAFIEYAVPEGESSYALNLNNLKQILKRAGAKDIVKMTWGNRVQILIQGKTKRTFYMPVIDLDEKEQKMPSLNFAATMTIPVADFKEAIEDAKIVGESLALIVENKELRVYAEGDLSKVNVEMGNEVKVVAKENVKSKYSIEYLSKFVGKTLSANSTLKFGNDYPLQYSMATKDNHIELRFILAPRVDND